MSNQSTIELQGRNFHLYSTAGEGRHEDLYHHTDRTSDLPRFLWVNHESGEWRLTWTKYFSADTVEQGNLNKAQLVTKEAARSIEATLKGKDTCTTSQAARIIAKALGAHYDYAGTRDPDQDGYWISLHFRIGYRRIEAAVEFCKVDRYIPGKPDEDGMSIGRWVTKYEVISCDIAEA